MKVKIWGARGSIPSPLKPQEVRGKIRQAILNLPDIDTGDPEAVDSYIDQLHPLERGTAGGNTTCVEVQLGSETIIIDAGSGLRELGLELMKGPCGRGQGTLHLFFTHLHWDHIQGFPFFVPAFVPGNQLYIYSVHDTEQTLKKQQQPITFPVPLSYLQATLEFVPIEAGRSFSIGDTTIRAMKTAHPGDAYAFRFEDEHSTFVFASDAEYKQLDEVNLRPYLEFFKDADLLFFDAQYTLREAWQKIDWGHSSALIGADIARAAGVKKLVLVHHDPTYSDAELMKIQLETMAYQAQDMSRPACDVVVAYEGLTFDLTPPGTIDLRRVSEGEEAVLTATGLFDERSTTVLERQLDHWEQVGWPSRLVIDLSQTESLSIAGLKLLISVRKEQPDTVIALAGLSEPVKQVIELAGFKDYFAIYPTTEAALAALQATETVNLPGQLIKERFRIENRLGDSWQGAVFKATNIHNNHIVALTILSASFGDKAIDQFLVQAQRLISFDHPNVAKVLDCGRDPSFSYVVEEFVEGQSLQAILADLSPNLLPAVQARDISLDILSALEYAHSRGVLHYNLSPRNVLLTQELKLTGFGQAGLEESRTPLLEGPLLFREAPYLAPEQILGQIRDARTDLYALGAILYELFTGQPPFTGTEQEVMRAHLYLRPEPPSHLNPYLSRSLEYLILKLLAKSPDERYATAHQTRQILSGVIVGDEEMTGLSTLLYREQKAFIGRASELEQLESNRDAMWQSGTPRLLLVRGERGVGKSRLVAEFLLRSIEAQDFTVVMGRCDDLGAPYTPFAEILSVIFNKGFVNPQVIADQSIHLTLQIPSLVSILGPYQTNGSNHVSTSSQRAQWYFFETVLQVLARLGPAVLFIDDAAYLDEASIALTRFLIRRGQLPLLLVVAGRDDEEANPWLSAFQSSKKEIINLQPFPEPEVTAFLASLMDGRVSSDVVGMVHKRTRGNPYYIEEIVSYLVTRNVLIRDGSGLWNYNPNGTADVLPPSLMQAFSLRMEKLAESRRIEDLTETSRQALAAAATIGAEFDVEIWTATLELDDGDQAAVALATLEEAMALRLVRQTGEKSFMFDPVDIADVLFSSQPETRQRKLHRQIAEVLSQKGTDPIDVSHHYQQAGLTAQAAHYLERAGVKAMADEAIDEAITYFDRALVLMESLTGYETLGSLYRQKGALAASTRAFEQALKLAEHARDTVGKARILNELTRVSLMNNLYDDARQAAATVLTLQGVSGADRATAEFHLGKISWVTGHLSQAEDWCRRSLETFEATRDQVRFATVSNQLGLIYFSRGRLAEATQAIHRSLGIHITLKDFIGQAYCLNNLGRIAIDEGKFDQAQAQLAEAQQLFEAADYARGLMLVFTNQGRVLLRQDRSGQALPVLRKALEQAKKLRPPTAYHLADMYLVVAQANLKHGNLSQAKASTEDALSLLEVTGNQDDVAAGQATLAQINAAEGETSTANTLFQRAIEQHNKAGNPTALLDTRLKYAHFLAEQDRVKEAEALEQAAREEAGRLGISW